VLADTVGFVRRLPHKLVDAFKATLEEVAAADLLLHVIDVSSPRCREQVENVQQVLEEIHADEIPRIDVLNKTDLLGDGEADLPPAKGERTRVAVSALTGAGMDALCSAVGHALAGELQRGIMVLRPDQGRARAWIYANGSVAEERADAEGCLHISVALSQAQIDSAQRQHGLVFRAFRQ
jgi:GTP-binding protein HflX